MKFLILVRHGQSTWNLEKRFTGWVDVDLTDQGKLEAEKAGNLIKDKNISIDLYYSSLQKRANNTLKIIQSVIKDNKNFVRAWELNERHYGSLTGLNKIEMIKKLELPISGLIENMSWFQPNVDEKKYYLYEFCYSIKFRKL